MAEATLSDIKQQLIESVEEQQDTNDEIRDLNKKFGLWMKNQDRKLDRERLANLEMLREMKKLVSNQPIAAGAGGLFGAASASAGIFGNLISGVLATALGASLLPLLKKMAGNLLKLTGIPLAISSIKSFFSIGKDGPGFFKRIVDSIKGTFDDLIERIKKSVSGIFDAKLGGKLGRILAAIAAIGAFFKIPNMPILDGPRVTTDIDVPRGGTPSDTSKPITGSSTGDSRPQVSTDSRGRVPSSLISPTVAPDRIPSVDRTPPVKVSDVEKAKKAVDTIPDKYRKFKIFLKALLINAPFLAADVLQLAFVMSSDMTEDEKVVAVGGILGSIGGSAALGAIAGLIAASWTGPIGSFIAGLIGAIAGGIMGDQLGVAIAKYLIQNDASLLNLFKPKQPTGPLTRGEMRNLGKENDESSSIRPGSSFTGNDFQIASSGDDWAKFLTSGSNRLPGPTTPMSLFTPPSYTGESGGEYMSRNNPVATSMKPDDMTGVNRIPNDMRFKNLPPEEIAKKKYPALKKLFWFLGILGVASLIPQIANAANENISDQQKVKNIATIVGPELAGVIIAMLMGNVAAAAGAATGPAAPIAGPVLGVVGGFTGYYIGSNLGEQASIKLAAWALGLIKLPELVEWARHSLTAVSQSSRVTNLARSVGTMMEMGAAYLGVDKKDFINRFRAGMTAANASLKSGKGLIPAALGLGVGFLSGRAPTNIEENPYVVNEILRNSRHFLNSNNAIAGFPGVGLPSVDIARRQNNRGRELYARSAEMFDMTRSSVALAYTPVVNAPSTSVQNNQSNFVSSGFIPSFDMTYEIR